MSDLVEETNNGVQFQNVKKVECEDKRTSMQCKIIHEDEQDTQGDVLTDDFVLEDAEVERFSQVKNKTSASFEEPTQCRIDEGRELLRCGGGMEDTTAA
jgi:hypothetical protein